MLGDAFGAGIVHHLCKADLDKIDEEVIKEIGEQALSPLSPMSPFDPFRRMSTHLEVNYEGAIERRRSVRRSLRRDHRSPQELRETQSRDLNGLAVNSYQPIPNSEEHSPAGDADTGI